MDDDTAVVVPSSLVDTTTTTKPNVMKKNSKRKILLVHVGKTGGSSLTSEFRVACKWYKNQDATKECYDTINERHSETQLSELTISYWHTNPRTGNIIARKVATTYLYSIRDPIDRFVSAYLADHVYNKNGGKGGNIGHHNTPKRNFYVDCFPTPESLAQKLYINCPNHNDQHDVDYSSSRRDDQANRNTTTRLLRRASSDNGTMASAKKKTSSSTTTTTTASSFSSSNRSNTINCTSLGMEVLHGGVKSRTSLTVMEHSAFNYKYYVHEIHEKFPTKEIFVVRTEHLWDDISKLDKMLHGTGYIYHNTTKKDHGSSNYAITNDLTPEGAKILCCPLYKELYYYQKLISLATNLQYIEKYDTLLNSYTKCDVNIGDHDGDIIANKTSGILPQKDWSTWHRESCPSSEYLKTCIAT